MNLLQKQIVVLLPLFLPFLCFDVFGIQFNLVLLNLLFQHFLIWVVSLLKTLIRFFMQLIINPKGPLHVFEISFLTFKFWLVKFCLCNPLFFTVNIRIICFQTRVLKNQVSNIVSHFFSRHYWVKILVKSPISHQFFNDYVDIGVIWVVWNSYILTNFWFWGSKRGFLPTCVRLLILKEIFKTIAFFKHFSLKVIIFI